VAPKLQVFENAHTTGDEALRKSKTPSASVSRCRMFDGPGPILRQHRLGRCLVSAKLSIGELEPHQQPHGLPN